MYIQAVKRFSGKFDICNHFVNIVKAKLIN